jgi:hypothetical protein
MLSIFCLLPTQISIAMTAEVGRQLRLHGGLVTMILPSSWEGIGSTHWEGIGSTQTQKVRFVTYIPMMKWNSQQLFGWNFKVGPKLCFLVVAGMVRHYLTALFHCLPIVSTYFPMFARFLQEFDYFVADLKRLFLTQSY